MSQENAGHSASALRRAGDVHGLTALFESPSVQDSNLRRHGVFGEIKKLDDVRTVPVLCMILEDDEDPTLRAAAAIRLGELRDRSAAPALRRSALDSDGRVRSRSVAALGALRDAADFNLFVRMLEDDYSVTRDCASEALGRLGDDRAVPALARMLRDAKGAVRHVAARALVTIGGPEAAQALAGAATQSRFLRRLILQNQARQAQKSAP
jgi:HEAT repeat protein